MADNIETVKKEECFGCSACMSICKIKAIEMKADKEGFMSPVVDSARCTGCTLCRQVCPAIDRWRGREETDHIYYAFQNTNRDVLAKSTSGGLFRAIVGAVESPNVCGCIMDDALYVKHILADDEAGIAAMQGSKYVQSDMCGCFEEIQNKLSKKENVIFAGTSCQTHGLLKFLSAAKVSTDTLLTLDLICHGVPSNLMYGEYIRNYKNKKHKIPVRHYFRSKRQKWGLNYILRNYEQTLVLSDNKQDRTSLESQLWINIFYSGLCLRECCYHCPYCCESKPADITMADFWGIEFTGIDFNQEDGCSLMIARGKGIPLASQISNVVWLNPAWIETARKYQIHLSQPSERAKSRDMFWNDYYDYGFLYVARKYLRFGFQYRIWMLLFHLFSLLNDKRFAQKIGSKLFY